MIVVDSSALVAILLRERERQHFFDRLVSDDNCLMSAVNAHETLTVLRIRRGPMAAETFWALVADLQLEIVPFDEIQVRAATSAFDRYGKGIDAKARLSICDCAAYALCKTTGAPLLFKGEDFIATDIVSAV